MKTKIKLTSAVKIHVQPTDEFNKYLSDLIDFQREVSQKIHSLILEKRITQIESFAIVFDGKRVKDASELRSLDWMKDIMKKFNLTEDNSNKSALRSIYWEVFRRYRSFLQRNKQLSLEKRIPKRPIDIRDKAINLKEGLIELHEDMDKVSFISLEKKASKIEVEIDPNKSYLKRAGSINFKKGIKKAGGIINIRKSELVVIVEREEEVESPVQMLGFDINKSDKNFLVFSSPINRSCFHAKPEHISKMEQTLRKINKEIKSNEINSRQRSKLRSKWKKQHKKLKRELTNFLIPLLDQIDFSKTGLAIDTPSTGQTNGSFGQDKIKEICIDYCKKNDIYYYLIPTPYTSQRCFKCGEISKTNRKKNKYSCSCGYKNHADLNGAKNVKVFGDYLLKINHSLSESLNRNYKRETTEVLRNQFDFKRNPISSVVVLKT